MHCYVPLTTLYLNKPCTLVFCCISVKILGDHINISLVTMNIFEGLIAEKAGMVKVAISLNTVRRKGQAQYNILAMEEIDDYAVFRRLYNFGIFSDFR